MSEHWNTHSPWRTLRPIEYQADSGEVRILDQTLLPFRTQFRILADLEASCEAILTMRVRGAPLIGLCGAFGMVLALRDDSSDAGVERAFQALAATRPTAVNLVWALQRLRSTVIGLQRGARYQAALDVALSLQREEEQCCERIAGHGLELLRGQAQEGPLQILTHCNAGWLATGAWGTALAPIYRAAAEGLAVHVWVDETRPRNQGGRLTAWELGQAGIPCTLIADNAAGALMQRGEVDLCLVGSDRTTAAGDVCNKIGTYQKALAARDNGLPFYVALPCSSIDWSIEDGLAEIPIEQRSASELTEIDGLDDSGALSRIRIAAEGQAARNDAFDVTPARLVSGILCEHGLFAARRSDLQRLRHIGTTGPGAVG